MQLNDRADSFSGLRLAPPTGLPGICGALLIDADGVVQALSHEIEGHVFATAGGKLDGQTSPGREFLAVADAATASKTGVFEKVVDVPGATTGQSQRLRVSAVSCSGCGPQGLVLLIIRHDFSDPAFQEKLLHIDRLTSLGTISASMAHEVKNALVAVNSFIGLLLEREPDAGLAQLVKRELGRIETIVAGTLRYAGPTPSEREPFQLHTVMEHALSLVGPTLKTNGIEVTQSLEAARDGVKGSSAELQQACVNLLLNAIEAMGQGGQLTIRSATARRPATSVSTPADETDFIDLSIQDSGAGIAPEDQARLFEPFFTTKPQGTGLGLAITRRIVEGHSGTISVQSEPGQGATFTISLPLAG